MNNNNNTTQEHTMTEQTSTVAQYFTAEQYSPYGMCKVVNGILADMGIDKVLPGPMFYTYTKKGYIPCTDKKVTRQDAIEWTEGYLAKLVTKMTVTVEADEDVEMTEPMF